MNDVFKIVIPEITDNTLKLFVNNWSQGCLALFLEKKSKITMDEVGNFSDSPWECNHVHRCMMKLIRMEKEKFESIQ